MEKHVYMENDNVYILPCIIYSLPPPFPAPLQNFARDFHDLTIVWLVKFQNVSDEICLTHSTENA